MKTQFYTTLFALGLTLAASAQNEQPASGQPITELPKGTNSEWFDRASSHIKEMEYSFRATGKDAFRVVNQANRTGFNITPAGYSVQALQAKPDQPVWNAEFQLAGIGRNEIKTSNNSYTIYNGKGAITYKSAALDIEYINDAAGLRQNFIIKEKPVGEGSLRVALTLETALTARIANNTKLELHTAGNAADVKLYYEDLKVWDANGTKLNAKMELNDANKLSIIVDDSHATYPVTVDPLNRTAEWMSSADGVLPSLLGTLSLQVQALYGFTVTGLGDINGDNKDDVAISAPGTADVINLNNTLASVGAVFVYFGSDSGLADVPDKVLQPTSLVPGALFGLSVAAGDISGDGKNDIVISAPLDRYQTTVSFGLGTINTDVTAGRVYYYRSEDLLNLSNPAPSLSIRLQGTTFFNGNIGGNTSVNALFGFALAVTEDMNNDGKADLIVGSPAYVSAPLLSVQNGAAFVFYSDALNTPHQLNLPAPSLLGLPTFPLLSTSGLLYGFSVDGVGDYNMDGHADLVVGAPAGVDLSSLLGIFNGQALGGTAYVYYGTGTGAGVNVAVGARLQANSSTLLGAAANLFGYKVKGARNAAGARTGNIIIGAPVGNVLSNVLGGLRVKAGEAHVFVRSSSLPALPTTPVVSTQTLSSPRSSSILGVLVGQNLNISMLYASSMDNMYDANCDGIGDLIIGEPMSTRVPLVGADLAGGAAYVYLGQINGTYDPTPFWTVTTTVSPLLGLNATALLGYSVAGIGYVNGRTEGVRALVGGPANSLDFGVGLLNLGNTLSTTWNLAADANGIGKSYIFPFAQCNIIILPSDLISFSGRKVSKTVVLDWTTVSEQNVNYYDLQHSTDGINFESLAMVFAKSQDRNDYTYTDKHPFFGINYYRLKTLDNDGRFKYSHVVTAKFDERLAADVVVAPNPALNNVINVKLMGLEQGTYKLELHNAGGQMIQSRTVRVSQYNQTETMNSSVKMPPGIYWLNIYNDARNRVKTVRVFMNNE